MVASAQSVAKQAQIAQLKAKLAAFDHAQEPFPTPTELRCVLPQGTFMRGATVTTNDCPALIIWLLEHFCAQNLMSVVVGWPELSYAGLEQAGSISNIVAIPDPGAHALEVLGLLEGFDCIVWHSRAQLTPTQARPLLAKMRTHKTLLLAVGAYIPARPHLEAHITGVHGLGQGWGRIERLELSVTGNHETTVVQL